MLEKQLLKSHEIIKKYELAAEVAIWPGREIWRGYKSM